MKRYAHIPLPRLLLPTITGIVLFLVFAYRFPLWWFAAYYALVFAGWLVFKKYFLGHFSRRWVFGATAGVLLLGIGYQLGQVHHQLYRSDHFSRYHGQNGYLQLRVIEPVSEKTNSYQVISRVERFFGDTLKKRVSGKLMVYLEKDSAAVSVRYGDILLIRNEYQPVRAPQNPGEFNYRRFLSFSNIYHSTYRRGDHWQYTGENQGFFLVAWSLALREKALRTLEEHHLSGREYAVVSALLLGYREYLDEDLRREFAGAGAMHILCVSGLHVGIIYLVLKFMFSFLKKMPYGKFMQTTMIILLIWLYAAITGFSPSVLRASTMFSFVAIGQSFHRTTNIYNTLAASAFVLILIDPYIITRIGFQLSYLAVFSIVALQPWLYRHLYFKNYFLDKAWAIVTVSIAAQLATGPLALFYFNQFPNYFLLTNLLVIPLASIIIYTALLTLLLTPVPLVGMLTGKTLSGVVFLLHKSVQLIEGLPYATTRNVFISLPETLVIFLILIFMGWYLLNEKRFGLKMALGLGLLLSVSFSARSFQNFRETRFVVYSVGNATAMDFITGKQTVLIGCERIRENPRLVGFHLHENRIRYGIKSHSLLVPVEDKEFRQYGSWARAGFFVWFSGKIFFLLNEPFPEISDAATLPVDYLLVTGNPRVDPEKVILTLQPGKVIIDSSNFFRTAERWANACEEMEIDYWMVREKGAYVAGL